MNTKPFVLPAALTATAIMAGCGSSHTPQSVKVSYYNSWQTGWQGTTCQVDSSINFRLLDEKNQIIGSGNFTDTPDHTYKKILRYCSEMVTVKNVPTDRKQYTLKMNGSTLTLSHAQMVKDKWIISVTESE